MKMTLVFKIICFFSVLFYCNSGIAADVLRASIPKMPVHSINENEGVLVDFVKVLANKLGQNIDIQLVSFSRSIHYVITNKVDFHLPFIKPAIKNSKSNGIVNIDRTNINDHNEQQPNFIYSDETIFHVNFVLYTRKNSTVDKNKIENYRIETDRAHLPFIPEIKMGSDCILCSLKKVQHKMTDGYIFADSSTDQLLLDNIELLSSIKRELYQKFAVKVVFPNTKEGQKLNVRMSAIITQMRLSGELDELLSSIDFPYDDWQI
jgi:hypothetical protein